MATSSMFSASDLQETIVEPKIDPMMRLPVFLAPLTLVAFQLSVLCAHGGEFVPIFDGKSLLGWKTLPGGTWEVVDGAIVGKSPKSEKRHGILMTDAQLQRLHCARQIPCPQRRLRLLLPLRAGEGRRLRARLSGRGRFVTGNRRPLRNRWPCLGRQTGDRRHPEKEIQAGRVEPTSNSALMEGTSW